ncbi:hypothetical protein SAMN05216436_1253 [bacterium A37T11]|nr:hypothetical protein SAMN05216436_1253 [bacterium A37T11]
MFSGLLNSSGQLSTWMPRLLAYFRSALLVRAADKSIADFVENFWMLHNISDNMVEATIVPNGRIDLSLFRAGNEITRLFLMGVETQADPAFIPPQTLMFVVSFKLLAVEYILHETVADVVKIQDGILFPQQNYADQSHFIKEAKKLSGVSPKELHKNKNGRFLQFSVLDAK